MVRIDASASSVELGELGTEFIRGEGEGLANNRSKKSVNDREDPEQTDDTTSAGVQPLAWSPSRGRVLLASSDVEPKWEPDDYPEDGDVEFPRGGLGYRPRSLGAVVGFDFKRSLVGTEGSFGQYEMIWLG